MRPQSKNPKNAHTSLGPLRGTLATFIVLLCALAAVSLESFAEVSDKVGRLSQQIRSFSIEAPLGWVTSVAWAGPEPGSGLFAVNTHPTPTIYHLSETGRLLGVIDSLGGAGFLPPQSLRRPGIVRSSPRGLFIQEDTTNSVYGVDQSLRVHSVQDLRSAPRAGYPALLGFYDWIPTAEGLLGLADVTPAKGAEDQTTFALLGSTGKLTLIGRSFPTLSNESAFYKLAIFSYLAAIDHTGYIVQYGSKPSLGRVDLLSGTTSPLSGFQWTFPPCPELDHTKGVHGSVKAFRNIQMIEGSTVPYGLFAWRGSLFLLVREGREEGLYSQRPLPRWLLLRLNQQTGAEEARVELPVSAVHLTVVPGDTWALIGKGEVKDLSPTANQSEPMMAINRLLLVEHRAIEAALGD